MIYSVVPTVYTNDTWTAGNHNLYVKDNFAHVEAQGEGEETMWIPIGAPWPQTGSVPHPLKSVDPDVLVYMGVPFDKDTDTYLNFLVGMPKRFDGNSCHFQVWWSCEGGSSGNAVFSLAMNELDDGDALGADPVAGKANVTDAWLANGDIHKSAWVEVTPNGSASDDNIALEMQIGLEGTHGSNNIDDDPVIIGVLLRWTANVEMDD